MGQRTSRNGRFVRSSLEMNRYLRWNLCCATKWNALMHEVHSAPWSEQMFGHICLSKNVWLRKGKKWEPCDDYPTAHFKKKVIILLNPPMIWKYKIVASDEYSVSFAKIHYPDDLQLRLIQIIIIVLKISIIDLSPFRFAVRDLPTWLYVWSRYPCQSSMAASSGIFSI